MPAVSVIVPNYNHARFLRRRIDSILAQTFQDFEVILLDDCSTDDSRSILSSYASDPRIRIEFNDANSGNTFKQWNKGVRLARGEYVWIAESDDYAGERFLERLLAVLPRDPAVAFAHCRSYRVTNGDLLNGFEDTYLQYLGPHGWDADFCVDGRQECRDYFVFTNSVPNASAVAFRKAVYERVGGADESLVLCGDWKLWAAMALTGRIAYVSQPLNYYQWHSATLRNKTARASVSVSVPESLQVVRWILDRVELSEAELTKVYKAHAAGWVPELMSTHRSLAAKSMILRYAKAVDPHPMRRAAGPAVETVRRKLLRHWRSVRSGI
ncbi:MAG TPA: glycosyltransferase [Candidatus Dormibacteraeota bacterium]|nr:glycosyltransferase [Candidatus Dormibacteraeota bacterium]